jgi:protein-tyrosine phosphatase
VQSFVDIHSHVIPSGDDGVESEAEGLELLETAASRGTKVIYGTPHVWPIDGLTDAREAAVRAAHRRMRGKARAFGVDLQLGFEVTPAEARHREDPTRYRLGELDAILIEVPFRGSIDVPFGYAALAEGAGLLPILAHPERSDAVLDEPSHVNAARERGWLVQVNASSVLGEHGRAEKALAWELLGDGLVDLVASDGHRPSRPPFLDAVYNVLTERLGTNALKLLDGSALARTRAARTQVSDKPSPV